MAIQNPNAKPWYKEPWPWILASGPLIVVIAGIWTFRIAVTSSDGLVSEDYYQPGLAVGKTIAQSDNAKAIGLTAHVLFLPGALKVRLSADAGFVPPPVLRASLSHPTRAGMDQAFDLPLLGADYEVKARLPESGNWLLLLEDNDKTWRLLGNIPLPAPNGAVIGAANPAQLVSQ
ncbi:MAG: FixH family protein [Rhodocyclaceae bacterium]|nr:FixH family protein [Rhodocyclaceae bacterium]